ncbi:MAG: hypothetical protein DMG88_13485 [Acidobacteria bacterium]|nr:MAG: hypothetical protein DMG88_13485 [Acidobacteriota bacterium]
MKIYCGDRECSLKSVNPPAARQFSKMGDKIEDKLNAKQNQTLRISPPNGTLLPGRTNCATSKGFCQCHIVNLLCKFLHSNP